MRITPSFAFALLAFAISLFSMIWIWSRPPPTCVSGFESKNNVLVQNPDTPVLVVGADSNDPAIARAEGNTIIFQDGFYLGANHHFKVTGIARDTTVLLYEDDEYSTVMARFIGPAVVLGDAPFTPPAGASGVFIAGFAHSGILNQWEQTTVYQFADGISVHNVIHTKIPGVRGTQLVSPDQSIDLVLATDGMIYIGDVKVSMRNANKGAKTVLVGDTVIIDEVYKNMTFNCTKIRSPSAQRYPTLLRYNEACGSYVHVEAVCVLPNSPSTLTVVDKMTVCNTAALDGYTGTGTQLSIIGECRAGQPYPKVYFGGDDSSPRIDLTGDGACQNGKFRWACVPRDVV